MPQLHTVLMKLAANPGPRAPGQPEDGAEEGYEMVLPIGTDGRLDAEAWQADPAACTVRGFVPGQPDWAGRLMLGELGWRIEPATEDGADAPAWRLEAQAVRPGDYVTVREAGGTPPKAFRIVSVR
jgi:hypothetical protein